MEKKSLKPLLFLRKSQIMKYCITDDRVQISLKLEKNTDIIELSQELKHVFNCSNSYTIISEESNILVFFGY